MRSAVTALISVLVLAGSAYGGNIALSSLGATATCGASSVTAGDPSCFLTFPYPGGTQYVPGNVIDGANDPTNPVETIGNEWVAPGGTGNPFLLVDLPPGGPFTVDSVSVYGYGSDGDEIGFSVYVGNCSSLDSVATCAGNLEAGSEGGTLIGSDTEIGGSWWEDTFAVSTATPIQDVLYDVTLSNCDGVCITSTTLNDAYLNEITVDATPEPATFGMIGAGLLALGFKWRYRKQK